MNNKFKIAAALTIAVTIIYTVIFAVMQHNGTLPVEKAIYVMSPEFAIPLPFTVSLWWSLLFFPISLILYGFFISIEIFVGKEPREGDFISHKKYVVRLHTALIPAISLGIGGLLALLCTLAAPWTSAVGGPLSALSCMVVASLICYICFGILISAAFTLFRDVTSWEVSKEEHGKYALKDYGVTNTYLQVTAYYVKNGGFFISAPLLLGHTIGYLLRMTCELFKVVCIPSKKHAIG